MVCPAPSSRLWTSLPATPNVFPSATTTAGPPPKPSPKISGTASIAPAPIFTLCVSVASRRAASMRCSPTRYLPSVHGPPPIARRADLSLLFPAELLPQIAGDELIYPLQRVVGYCPRLP